MIKTITVIILLLTTTIVNANLHLELTQEEKAYLEDNYIKNERIDIINNSLENKIDKETFDKIAIYIPKEEILETIKRADDQLYLAKKSGRNQVKVIYK